MRTIKNGMNDLDALVLIAKFNFQMMNLITMCERGTAEKFTLYLRKILNKNKTHYEHG